MEVTLDLEPLFELVTRDRFIDLVNKVVNLYFYYMIYLVVPGL